VANPSEWKAPIDMYNGMKYNVQRRSL
jgi:hypothetical protein